MWHRTRILIETSDVWQSPQRSYSFFSWGLWALFNLKLCYVGSCKPTADGCWLEKLRCVVSSCLDFLGFVELAKQPPFRPFAESRHENTCRWFLPSKGSPECPSTQLPRVLLYPTSEVSGSEHNARNGFGSRRQAGLSVFSVAKNQTELSLVAPPPWQAYTMCCPKASVPHEYLDLQNGQIMAQYPKIGSRWDIGTLFWPLWRSRYILAACGSDS